MANSTFTGPVRSQNGFQSITVDSTTGAVTVDAIFASATIITDLTASGIVKFTGLPTSDPAVAGQLWNDTGTLKVSAG
jgi:hypothetical protein